MIQVGVSTPMFIGLQFRIAEPETTFFCAGAGFHYFAVICYCLKLDGAWQQSTVPTGRLLLEIPSALFSKPVLWIQIHLIWIRIQDYGPIWIRIQGYMFNQF